MVRLFMVMWSEKENQVSRGLIRRFGQKAGEPAGRHAGSLGISTSSF